MCCHQCSTSTASPVTPERSCSLPQSAGHSAWSTPIIQVNNYFASSHEKMPVINGGGGHQFSHPSATRENLQRASTVNVAPSTSFKRHFADHTAFIDASCCSNNLNRTHSIHICVLTGSDHYKDCTRKHLPSRLRNSMRRKLSLLQGLCKKSSQAEDQAKPCKPRQNTRSGGINAWLDRTLTRGPSTSAFVSTSTDDVSRQVEGRFELAATDVPYVREPAKSVASLNTHPVQADSVSRGELPCNPTPFAAELSDCQTLPTRSIQQYVASQPMSMQERQWSGVSALSSPWEVSTSGSLSNRQMSGMSTASDFTPATSFALTDGSSFGLPTHTDKTTATRPELSLETHLSVPSPLAFAGALTESPSEMEGCANEDPSSIQQHSIDQQRAQDSPHALGHIQTRKQLVDAWLPFHDDYSLNLTAKTQAVEGNLVDGLHDNDKLREDLQPSSSPRPSAQVLHDNHNFLTNDPAYVAVNGYMNAECLSDLKCCDRRKDCVPALVAACDVFASTLLRESEGALPMYLQDCFDLTLSHYLTHSNRSNQLHSLCSENGAWGMAPTIEAALHAFRRIMSFGLVPSPYQLISLAFFSLSLIYLSLETHDLEQAVYTLHLNAKSWGKFLGDQRARQAFEDLVDDLWLPGRGGHSCERLQEHTFNTSFDTECTTPMWWAADDFILQVAERFIALTLFEEPLHETLPPPYSDLMAREHLEFLSDLSNNVSHEAQQSYMASLEQFHLMGAIHNYHSLHSFTRQSNAHVNDGGLIDVMKTMKHLLKVFGRRCIGSAAQWLSDEIQNAGDEIQNIARRVVSHPQWPYKTGQVLTAPTTRSTPRRKIDRPSRPDSDGKGSNRSGSKSKSKRRRRANVSETVPQTGPWECKEHGKIFTDRSNYMRHMDRTVEHGHRPYACPHCPARLPRSDHLESHLKRCQGKRARGGSGENIYETIPEPTEKRRGASRLVAELEGTNAVHEMPAPEYVDDMDFEMSVER